MSLEPMLAVSEIATATGLGEKTIRRAIERGELKAHRLGERNLRVRESEVEGWLERSLL